MAVDKLIDSTQLNSDLTSIANAIRAKSGGSGALAFPAGFISEIGNITTGGGGGTTPEAVVKFIDYDGTLVATKTKTEINAMTSDSDLPANPTHTGLTAQGWNWTVAQLKAQFTAIPDQDIIVGQMYITTSGKTEIDVEFDDAARLSPILTICVNGEVSVDWGDNTTPNTVTGTSLTSRKAVGPHDYATTGNYKITITAVSGTYSFYNTSSYLILRKDTSQYGSSVYANRVKTIRLGNGIALLNNYAFNYCTSLTSITIPNGVTSIGNNAFNNCYSLASIVIPSSVTSIGNNAFNNCHSLASIVIPNGVTSIGGSAFYNCYSLASITIPNGVTNIGAQAFSNTGGLKEIHVLPTTIPTAETAIFNSIPSDCVIYVPTGMLTDYQNASNWSTYASKMQEEPAA